MKRHLFANRAIRWILQWSGSALGLLAAFGARGEGLPTRDLAVAAIVAPPKVRLSAEYPVSNKPVVVVIQNRGSQTETIPDLARLTDLVALEVQSLGPLADRKPVLVAPMKFPITLHPKRKLGIVFTVTFDGANDPARSTPSAEHDDFHYVATVHPDALGEGADTRTENDAMNSLVDTDVVLAPSFTSDGAIGPAAKSRRSAASAEAASARAYTARLAVRAATFTRLTANPMAVVIKPGQTLSEPITFTAVYSGASSGLSWGAGDAAKFSYPSKNTFKAQWNSPGDHTVTAYIFDGTPNPPHKSVTIQVIKLRFEDEDQHDPNGLIIGVTTPKKNRSRTIKAIVEPASQSSNVTIRIGKGSDKLALKGSPTVAGSEVTFAVEGIGRTGSKTHGDCTIEAVVNGSPVATAAVSVVVPKFIASQSKGAYGAQNVVANEGTSPSQAGVSKVEGVLVTSYGWPVTVTVTDQFHEPIGDPRLYVGSLVSEAFPPKGRKYNVRELRVPIAINQSIRADSTYLDPVAATFWRNYPAAPTRVPYLSAESLLHSQSPSPVFGLPNVTAPETRVDTFRVHVEAIDGGDEGFPLDPPITRTLTLSPGPNLSLSQTP